MAVRHGDSTARMPWFGIGVGVDVDRFGREVGGS